MDKKNIIITIFTILVLIVILSIGFMTVYTGTEYSTYGAITYFDKEGRYQLINPVGEYYALYDAKTKKFFEGLISYYIFRDDKVYMIKIPSTDETKNKKEYAILNLGENEYLNSSNINVFSEEEKQILLNTTEMVDLTKKRSQDLKHMMKFLPQKWREW